MKNNYPLALIASGPTRHNLFSKINGLSAQLGPVKSRSLRVASKVSNALKAGWPCAEWRDILEREFVFVCCPGADLQPIVDEMGRAGNSWSGRTIVFCTAEISAGARAAIDALGGSVVTLSVVRGSREPVVTIDGSDKAASRVHRILRDAGADALVVRNGAQKDLMDSVASIEAGSLAILQTATDALCSAGLRGEEARTLAAEAMQEAVKRFTRSRERLGPQHKNGLRRAGELLARQASA
jgi:hypothetical protein